MGIDVILGIIIFVVVLLLPIFPTPIFNRWGLRLTQYQFGSRLMVAFLAGFIVFILFTDRIPQPGQKIPIIIAALLLIWANLFLNVGGSEEPRGDDEDKVGKKEG
jgi:Na+/proline symporter